MKISSIRMKLTAVFITALFATNAWALPPQAEADKLMIEAKAAMDAKDYGTAARDFARVEELHVRVPATFAYHYGVALSEIGEFDRAKQQLDRYITKAGSAGKFYKEALEQYAEAEAGIKYPDQVEADRLMLEIKSQMINSDYAGQVSNFARLEKLRARLPASFSYHYGNALAGTGQWTQAQEKLNRYLTEAGAGGVFYKEALEKYNEVKRRAAQ